MDPNITSILTNLHLANEQQKNRWSFYLSGDLFIHEKIGFVMPSVAALIMSLLEIFLEQSVI